MLEDLAGHTLGQIDKTVVILDVDSTYEAPFEPRLIGDGADDFSRSNPITVTDLDAVTDQASLVTLAPAGSPIPVSSDLPPQLHPLPGTQSRSLIRARVRVVTVETRRSLAPLERLGPLRARGAIRVIRAIRMPGILIGEILMSLGGWAIGGLRIYGSLPPSRELARPKLRSSGWLPRRDGFQAPLPSRGLPSFEGLGSVPAPLEPGFGRLLQVGLQL